MSASTKASSPDTATRFPPVTQIVTGSLGLIVIGGIFMASYAPRRPPLAFPIVLLVCGALLLAFGVVLMVRIEGFAWAPFRKVQRWAQLAYLVSAGMIEYAFVRNHTRGATLAVLTLMLVVFALDVPVLIGFTVARYERRNG